MKTAILFLMLIVLKIVFVSSGWTNNAQVRLGPRDKSKETYDAWKSELDRWVEDASKSVNTSIYDDDRVSWARTSFVQPQLMFHDRFLYDRIKDEWTVEKYLADVIERYGGIDSVLLWQGYPNIGVDDRNQFDMLDSLPGGLEGLKKLVNDFSQHNVRVLLA